MLAFWKQFSSYFSSPAALLLLVAMVIFLPVVVLADHLRSADSYYFAGSGLPNDPELSPPDTMIIPSFSDTGKESPSPAEMSDTDNEDDGVDSGSSKDCNYYYVGSGLCGDPAKDSGGGNDDSDDDEIVECTLTGTDLSDITNYPPPNGPIIAFGNSLTAGVGASMGEDYVSELEERLNVNIVNEGVPGDTTEDALARLDGDVLARDPSVVIIWLGGNDELRRIYERLQNTVGGTALEDELEALAVRFAVDDIEDMPLLSRAETFDNIETIIEAIQNTGAVTILIGFDPSLYDASIADNYEMIAEDTGSIFVPDIYDNIFGNPFRMSDLIHPNNAGYDIIAERIEPALRCALPNR